jgi:hypothetical protein
MLVLRQNIFRKLNHAPDGTYISQLSGFAGIVAILVELGNLKGSWMLNGRLNNLLDLHQVQNGVGHSYF